MARRDARVLGRPGGTRAWCGSPCRWARPLPRRPCDALPRPSAVPRRPHTACPRPSAAPAAASTESTSAAASPTLECHKPRAASINARVLGRPGSVSAWCDRPCRRARPLPCRPRTACSRPSAVPCRPRTACPRPSAAPAPVLTESISSAAAPMIERRELRAAGRDTKVLGRPGGARAWCGPPYRRASPLPRRFRAALPRPSAVPRRPRTTRPQPSAAPAAVSTKGTSAAAAQTLECHKPRAAGNIGHSLHTLGA